MLTFLSILRKKHDFNAWTVTEDYLQRLKNEMNEPELLQSVVATPNILLSACSSELKGQQVSTPSSQSKRSKFKAVGYFHTEKKQSPVDLFSENARKIKRK